MTHQVQGLLVGGLIPAVIFDLIGLCQRWVAEAKILRGFYLICGSIGLFLAGFLTALLWG